MNISLSLEGVNPCPSRKTNTLDKSRKQGFNCTDLVTKTLEGLEQPKTQEVGAGRELGGHRKMSYCLAVGTFALLFLY